MWRKLGTNQDFALVIVLNFIHIALNFSVVGDQILEIDGEACVDAKHSFVVRLLQKNEGTIQ